jgi:hypothetical protein
VDERRSNGVHIRCLKAPEHPESVYYSAFHPNKGQITEPRRSWPF